MRISNVFEPIVCIMCAPYTNASVPLHSHKLFSRRKGHQIIPITPIYYIALRRWEKKIIVTSVS